LDSDKVVIISGAWANSSVINASQCTMNKQFDLQSFCFQGILYRLTMNYSPIGNSFIQLIHMITTGTTGVILAVTLQTISMFMTSSFHVATLLFSHKWLAYCKHRIQVLCKFCRHVQYMQDGYNDCGMLSTDYTVALCIDEQVIFDQQLMGEHLCTCIQQRHFL